MKFLITIFFILLLLMARAQNMPLVVISNAKGAPAELSLSELKSIMLGERQRWGNGKKILIALMKTNTAAGKYTCERIYEMSEDEVKKFWLAMVFQGRADPPSFFETATELQNFIATNPGAIGIVDQASPLYATHVVLINGKRSF